MNILYYAPAYHPNQTPIVKGWVEAGDKVKFICQYHMDIEDHQYAQAEVLPVSGFYKFMEACYKLLKRGGNAAYPEYFSDKCAYPQASALRRVFRECQPDLVIVRERSFYSMRVYAMARRKGIPCLLYNQTPLYDPEPPRNDLAHRIVKKLTPARRYTPVYGNPDTGYLDENASYIPFVVEPKENPQERYGKSAPINILSVGKYEDRKNHIMLVDVCKSLADAGYSIRLTLVGNTITDYHRAYLERLRKHVADIGAADLIDIYENVSHDDMDGFYRAADLFVIPSTAEFASVSQLEAMAYSLPVIVSDSNGTACYVENGGNGYHFKDMDEESLKEAVKGILDGEVMSTDGEKQAGEVIDGFRELATDIMSTNTLEAFGRRSYELVCEKHSFSSYRENIMRMMQHAI